ncbi:hypothetical protein BH20ACI1_BH20ACI1_30420 [soil metagenome]
MKQIIFLVFILIVLISPAFASFNLRFDLFTSITVDQLFDTYQSDISWNDERAHLDNFAIYLKKESELIGYIYIFSKENESVRKSKSRTNRIVKYLTKNIGSSLEIEKSRIVFIYKKNTDRSETILQPVLKGFKPPEL